MNDAIVQSWEINSRLNLYLLEGISSEQPDIKLVRGRTVLGNFAHILNVRRMWVGAAAPDLHDKIPKLEEPCLQELIEGLALSTGA